MEINALKAQCTQVRRDIISMLAKAGSGHPGGSLSAVEILVALYGNVMNVKAQDPHNAHRDRFVLSKGHAAPALYGVLAENGFFPKEMALVSGEGKTETATVLNTPVGLGSFVFSVTIP